MALGIVQQQTKKLLTLDACLILFGPTPKLKLACDVSSYVLGVGSQDARWDKTPNWIRVTHAASSYGLGVGSWDVRWDKTPNWICLTHTEQGRAKLFAAEEGGLTYTLFLNQEVICFGHPFKYFWGYTKSLTTSLC